MIGSGLKKLAVENGMRIDKGVAYGSFHGYAATFSEGSGYKLVSFITKIPDVDKRQTLELALQSRDIDKEFRVQNWALKGDRIDFQFLDFAGTLKKMSAFFDWFFPLLDESGATGANICAECGMPLSDSDPWKLIGDAAFHLHESCANQIAQRTNAILEREKAEDTGSYLTGSLGALLGALLGAIPWALVMYLGYFASALGLLIGWLSKKGYELLHGKNGIGKLIIVILFSLLGVVAGCFGSDLLTMAVEISKGVPGVTYSDIPALFGLLFADSEYVSYFLQNLALGGVFAILGLSGTFRQLKSEQDNQSFSMKNLD